MNTRYYNNSKPKRNTTLFVLYFEIFENACKYISNNFPLAI